MSLSQSRLKELLHYNPDTGIFTCLLDRGCQVKPGDIVGCKNDKGYLLAMVNGKLYLLHRLAFLYMDGYFPECIVDHKNGTCDDNRWDNLRHVSYKCNAQNRTLSSTNKSGYTGVSFHKQSGKWRAVGTINKKNISLGLFIDPLQAALARWDWEISCPEWTCNHRSELIKAIHKETNRRSQTDGA